ncbi:uncharacterized protein LOC116619385 [Nematostella vectensis]|uniref:uncharacterized protein LOC116619385 n=1 Tax=Nematostella vectensis TaxID=45351 RepID=UPI002076DD1C|nr:uncharacterized protein LOC116619385 [Nematostella vectensis]
MLKQQFGNNHRVEAAHLKSMVDGPDVVQGDRQSLRSFHYKVKACVQWCTKLGLAAILQNPEYLGRAAMKLQDGMRMRWYEHLQGDYDGLSLLDFERWLQRRVDAMFNPFEDYVHERESRPRLPRPRHFNQGPPPRALHPNSVGIRVTRSTQESSSGEVTAPPQVDSPGQDRCLVCEDRHRLVYCDSFKSKPFKERRKIVYNKRLCRNCLKEGHFVDSCPSSGRCLKEGCGLKHHTLLHSERVDESKSEEKDGAGHKVNALQLVPVLAWGPKGQVKTVAVLDAGSDSTLIRKDLAEQLELKGETHQLQLNTVKSDTRSCNMQRVGFRLSSDDHPEKIDVEGAWVVHKLNISKHKVSGKEAAKRWNHLEGVNLQTLEAGDVTLLIGSDMAHLLVHLDVRQGRPGEPIAVQTPLGWTLFGRLGRAVQPNLMHVHSNLTLLKVGELLNEQVQRFWETDSYGVSRTERPIGPSAEDRRALETLDSTVRKMGGHYETGLLWKDEAVVLPSNRRMAMYRLNSTEQKLKKDPELASMYRSVLNEYQSKGHCRKLSEVKAAIEGPRTWYLPHHGVQNPNKPEKLRVVFHPAAKYNNVSLNDCLLTGPDLLNDLVGVLIRFRCNKVGIMGDIEKMFHQVKVREADQDSLRFLWRNLEERILEVYRMAVHVFGAIDSPCSACYALRKTAEDQAGLFPDDVLDTIKRNFYMDDVLTSRPSEDEAAAVANQLIEAVAAGGFRLTKWVSNSRNVLRSLPSDEVSCDAVNLDLQTLPQEKALGVKWCLEQDTLYLKPLKDRFPETKRKVLSATSSVFDPLGLAARPSSIYRNCGAVRLIGMSLFPKSCEASGSRGRTG